MGREKGSRSSSSYKVVILAGGRSRRFGVDKCSFEWNGKSFLDRLLEEFTGLEVFVITDRPRRYPNEILDKTLKGPFVALNEFVKGNAISGKLFVVGCDHPFATRKLAEVLCSFEREAVVPLKAGKPQYSLACYKSDVIREGCTSFRECIKSPLFLSPRELIYYGIPEIVLFSANSPKDLILSPIRSLLRE
jgi:molybdopterin-guanine dinucleotide biosynthesis protein A